MDRVADGVALGWARDAEAGRPCRVAVVLAGRVLGEAFADAFRPDLLLLGIGHGHHAFAVRLRAPLPRGVHRLQLRGPDGEETVGDAVDAPEPAPLPPVPVTALLSRGDQWRAADVLAGVACLAPEANLAAMGPARFVDCCYRFVLGRWPGAHEAAPTVESLGAGSLAAAELLRIMLASPERQALDAPLASPYDAAFPFTLSGRAAR